MQEKPPSQSLDKSRKHRLGLLLVGCAVVILGLAFGTRWYVQHRNRPPSPPDIELADFDPEVREAIKAALLEVRQEPRSGTSWGRLGMVLFANGLEAEALTCFAQAEKLDTSEPHWPYYQGLLQLQRDSPAGIACLERAGVRAKDQLAPRLRLAEALLGQGRLDDAEPLFRDILERARDNPRVLLGLGQVAFQRGDLHGALPMLSAAVNSPYSQKAASLALGEIHQRLGQASLASQELQKSGNLPPDTPWPDPWLAEVESLQSGVEAGIDRAERLLREERGAEAFALLQQIIKKRPETARAYLVIGRAALQQRQAALADEALREAVRHAPNDVTSHFLLAGALYLQKDYRHAAEWFRKTIALKPAYAEAHFNLAKCLVELGDSSGAIDECRSAVRYKPQLAEVHRYLGELLASKGQQAEALVHLQDAIRINSSDEKARRLFGQLMAGALRPGMW